jgi:hypothetical protein
MPELPRTNEGKRICQVIKVKPEALDEYKKVDILARFPSPSVETKSDRQCHAAVWPEVLEALRKSHVVGEFNCGQSVAHSEISSCSL